MAVRMAAPHNNQGKFGTCCGHAFSTVVVNGIVASMASSLYIEQAHLFAKVETLCDCWEGHDPLAMCEEWNGVSGKKEAWVPTLEKKEAYQIKVEHGGKITSFDKAHDTMKKWANGLCMIGVITTSVGGHGLHAVCIQYADDSAVVRACKPPTHGVRRMLCTTSTPATSSGRSWSTVQGKGKNGTNVCVQTPYKDAQKRPMGGSLREGCQRSQ